MSFLWRFFTDGTSSSRNLGYRFSSSTKTGDNIALKGAHALPIILVPASSMPYFAAARMTCLVTETRELLII